MLRGQNLQILCECPSLDLKGLRELEWARGRNLGPRRNGNLCEIPSSSEDCCTSQKGAERLGGSTK
jgi:hypothetical protein